MSRAFFDQMQNSSIYSTKGLQLELQHHVAFCAHELNSEFSIIQHCFHEKNRKPKESNLKIESRIIQRIYTKTLRGYH